MRFDSPIIPASSREDALAHLASEHMAILQHFCLLAIEITMVSLLVLLRTWLYKFGI